MFHDIYGAVELREMLDARECLAARQQKLQTLHGLPLISFTMNIAGPYKRSFAIDRAFDEGVSLIEQRLARAGIAPVAVQRYEEKTGCRLLMALSADAVQIKALMTDIEEMSPLGRLFDIDVIDTEGEKVSRAAIGFAPRRCLICGEDAFVCSRSRAHSIEELRRKSHQIIADHLQSRLSADIASMALRSLLYEVAVTPKPGLVDRANSGAHHDMDFFSFVDSASALTEYFREAAMAGLNRTDLAPGQLFSLLRWPGMLAEKEMFRATGGVNTHKGAIFSMGILCAAAGRLSARGVKWSAQALSDMSRNMIGQALAEDFGRMHPGSAVTAGERLYCTQKITGARGEAASGFASALQYGLPVLRAWTMASKSPDEAGSAALVSLMAHVTDTNMISRSSPERQAELQQQMRSRLAQGALSREELSALDQAYIAEHVSPGGCADLLAVCFFFLFAEEAARAEAGERCATPEDLGRLLGRAPCYEGELVKSGENGSGFRLVLAMPCREAPAQDRPCAAVLMAGGKSCPCLVRFEGESVRCRTAEGTELPGGFARLEVQALCPEGQSEEELLRHALALLQARGLCT